MSCIQTGIELHGNIAMVLIEIISQIDLAVPAMQDLSQYMLPEVDTTAANPVQAAQSLDWQPDVQMPVIETSSLQRYQQEVQKINSLLDNLINMQGQTSQAAAGMDILPAEAISDITSLFTRLDGIKHKIQEIENNPVTMGASAANAELEQLREQLSKVNQEQMHLKDALANMDMQEINSAYLNLSKAIGTSERYIRDNTPVQQGQQDKSKAWYKPPEGFFNGLKGVAGFAGGVAGKAADILGNIGVLDIGASFDRIDTMDNFKNSVAAITGDEGMAGQALANLQEITAGTPYGMDTAANAAQGFIAQGMETGAATEQVRVWSDAVSYYGGGTDGQLEGTLDAVGRMYSTGYVEAEQLEKLFASGVDAAGIYAEAVGESVSQVKEDLSNKNISSAEFIDTVSQAMDNGASSGAAKGPASSWTSAVGSVQEAATTGWAEVISSFDNELTAHGLPGSMEMVQSFGQAVGNVLSFVAGSMGGVIDLVIMIIDAFAGAGSFIADNWGIIGPVIYGVAAALGAYCLAMGLVKTIELVSTGIKIAMCVAEYAHAAATGTAVAATTAETAAQLGLNTALLSCPLVWIIAVIAILIGVVIALANHFSGAGHVAQSTFGAICGGVNVVIQFFKNLGLSVANIALGIWEALGACAENVQTAFHNSICNVKSFFYGMVSTVLRVVETICEALNKLPFVEFDYSGLSQAADDYALKSLKAASEKEEYTSISDAFNRGMDTYDTFKDGWVDDAYREGAAWGDDVTKKVKSFFVTDKKLEKEDEKEYDYAPHVLAQSVSMTAANTDDTAKNTAKTAGTLSMTGEDLKYLRDMAERDYVNKFTTAEIKVNMTNHNKINKDMDLDGLSAKLCKKIEEDLYASAEGVY